MTVINSEQLDQLRDAYRAASATVAKGSAYDGLRTKVTRRAVLAKRDELGLGELDDATAYEVAQTATSTGGSEPVHEPGTAGGDDLPDLAAAATAEPQLMQSWPDVVAATKAAAEQIANALARDPSTVEGSTVTVHDGEGNVLAQATAPQAETLDDVLTAMESHGMPTDDPTHREIAAHTAQKLDEMHAQAEAVLDSFDTTDVEVKS